ncbi:MAG: DUF3325 family protein [Pseudomonadota bacterium]
MIITLAINLLAFMTIAFSMKRHLNMLGLSNSFPSQYRVLILLSGFLLLLISLSVCIADNGTEAGATIFFGLSTMSILVTALILMVLPANASK